MEVIVGIIMLVVMGVFLILVILNNGNEVKKRNLKRKLCVQKVFSQLSIGTDFFTVINRFGQCEGISTSNLESESILENGIRRTIYVWYLDWDYTVSKSSGVMPYYTYGNNGSFNNGMGYITGKNTKKALIRIIFEKNKLVAKEQQGLYQ